MPKTTRSFAILLIFLWFFLCFSTRTGLTASFNFSASRQYIIKGQSVEFSLSYERGSEGAAQNLEIRLDHDGDRETDHTISIDNPDSTVTRSRSGVFNSPGYFDAEAVFILTFADGTTITEDLGPLEINVANWKFTAGGCIESTPAVSPDGSTIYFGAANHHIYAVSAQDGSKKWDKNLYGDVDSSPAVDSAGNVYVGSEDKHVYCLEPETGAIEWQFPSGSQGKGYFFSSPALDEVQNRLYIGSTDNFLYALDMDTGQRLWRFQTGSKIVSSPAVGFDHTVYIGSLDGYLYALNPNGSLKWKFKTESQIRGAPALDRDGTIYFGTSRFRGEAGEGNGLYAVSTMGQKKWFTRNFSGIVTAPVIDDDSGTVVVGSWDNRLYGAKRSGGLNMYKTFQDDVLSTAALGLGNYLFAGSKDGIFYAMDSEQGNIHTGRNELWDYSLPRPVAGSSPVIHNGYVYVGTCETDGEEGSGALYSFWGGKDPGGITITPAEDSPWPLFRNDSQNRGKTDLRPGTVAPEVAKTSPSPGVREFNIDRRSITAEFSMPMDPDSIYQPPNNDFDGFFGFTVEPFENPPEDFTIDWNAEQTVFTLTLPDGESFEDETQYTATIKSRAHAQQPHAEDGSERRILYDYEWTFEHDPEESHDNSHNRFTCFISSIWESSPLDFMADLW